VQYGHGTRAQWGLRDVVVGSLVAGVLFAVGVFAVAVGWVALQFAGIELSQGILLLAVLLGEAAMLLPAWWFGPGKHGGGLAALGFRGVPIGKLLWMTALGLVVAFGFNALWSIALSRLGWATQPDLVPIFGRNVWGYVAALVIAAGVAPLAEEVFFRGFLQAGLENRFGAWVAIILTAALFALVHVLPGVLPPIFVLGLIFGILRFETDSLWPAILLHGAFNALSVTAAYLMELMPQAETAWPMLMRLWG
jgi:hypothetical protein